MITKEQFDLMLTALYSAVRCNNTPVAVSLSAAIDIAVQDFYDELKKAEAFSTWTPVEDVPAPIDGTVIRVCNGNGESWRVQWRVINDDEGYYGFWLQEETDDEGPDDSDVTHWIADTPLPKSEWDKSTDELITDLKTINLKYEARIAELERQLEN